jgi:uncharacterized protein YndB with AHSA1/START domain
MSTEEARSVRLHRVLRAPPHRVYRAFLEAGALERWLPPYGYLCSGNSHSFGGDYLELVPDQRIRYTDRFDDPNLPGVMHVTVELTAVSCGTELAVVQAGIPDLIPLEMCYLGWQESLQQLARLVEPEIPG